jgi:hypothetical protein
LILNLDLSKMGLFDCGIPGSGLAALKCKGYNVNKDFDEISEFYSFAQEMDEEDDHNMAAMSGLYSFAQDDERRLHGADTRRIEDDLDASVAAFDVDISTDRSAMYYRHEQEIEEKLKQFLQVGAQATSVKARVEKAAEKFRNPQAQPSRRCKKKEQQQPAYIRIFCRLQEHSSFVVFCFDRKANDFTCLVNAIGLKLLGQPSLDGTLYLMQSANEYIEVGDIQTIRDEDRFVFVPFEPAWVQECVAPSEDREPPLQGEMYIQDNSLDDDNVANQEGDKINEELDPISPVSSLPWDEAADKVGMYQEAAKPRKSQSRPSKHSPTSVVNEYGSHHMDQYEHADQRREHDSTGHYTRESPNHHHAHQYDEQHQEHPYDERQEASGSKTYQSRERGQELRSEAPIEDGGGRDFERKRSKSRNSSKVGKPSTVPSIKYDDLYNETNTRETTEGWGRAISNYMRPESYDDGRSHIDVIDAAPDWDEENVIDAAPDWDEDTSEYIEHDIREQWRDRVRSKSHGGGRSHSKGRQHRDPSAQKYIVDKQHYAKKAYVDHRAIATSYYAGRIGIDPLESVDYAMEYDESLRRHQQTAQNPEHNQRRYRSQQRRKVKQN